MIELDDGQLTFTIRRDGKPEPWTVDLITAKLVAEQWERTHDLEVREIGGVERMLPTPEFLEDLASQYEILGAVGCTPTAARTIWMVVHQKHAQMTARASIQVERVLDPPNYRLATAAGVLMLLGIGFVGYLMG